MLKLLKEVVSKKKLRLKCLFNATVQTVQNLKYFFNQLIVAALHSASATCLIYNACTLWSIHS